MRTVFRFRRFWFSLLAVPAIAAALFAAEYPSATERVYSAGIYPVISGFFARIYGAVPFSLAEFVLVTVSIAFLVYIYASIKKIINHPEQRKDSAARFISTLLCAAGLILFGFVFLCGLNYHRESFTVSSGLTIRPSSSAELKGLCEEIAEKTNEYSTKVERDKDNVMVSGFKDYYEAAKHAPDAYGKAAAQYPILGGYTPRAKPVLASRAMSLADIVGVYFPFTFEANVNVDVPAYEIPSSMLHELAHYKGFMREDEANFVAYSTCLASGNDDFTYSGLMLALIHSSNALYSADKDAYWEIINRLEDGILADFAANTAYWKQFEGPVADFSEKVNDVYLKSNRQTEGVKSYGRMVDLLLAQYRKEHNMK